MSNKSGIRICPGNLESNVKGKTASRAKGCSNRAHELESKPVEAIEDRWSTYKDSLKRKRDYKRNMRKRRNDKIPDKSENWRQNLIISNVYLPNPNLRMAIRMVPQEDGVLERLIAKQSIEELQQLSQQIHRDSCPEVANEEVVDNEEEEYCDDNSGMGAQDHAEKREVDVEIQTSCSQEIIVQDSQAPDNDDEFTERWNILKNNLMAVPLDKRLRYLSLIEGIVDEFRSTS